MQGELLPVQHRSLQPNRLRKETVFGHGNPERVFAAQWLRENRKSRTGGWTTLDIILAPFCKPTGRASRRDAEVAACVIQWLGTNCGHAFLMTCEDKIDPHHERARQRFDRKKAKERAISQRHQAEIEAQERRTARVSRRLDLSE